MGTILPVLGQFVVSALCNVEPLQRLRVVQLSGMDLVTLLKNRGMRPADLARALRVDKGTVSRWSKKGVPSDRLEEVEKVTGILACDIRPDLARVFVRSLRSSENPA